MGYYYTFTYMLNVHIAENLTEFNHFIKQQIVLDSAKGKGLEMFASNY